MMKQLDLFGSPAPPPLPPSIPEPEEPEVVVPDVLAGQIGLFDARSLHLGRARAAVALGDLDAACLELDALRLRSPDDPQVAREALEIHALRERLARIQAPRTKQRARALLALSNELSRAPEPLASLRRRLLSRVAAELRKQQGDAAELEGRLAGEYSLDAGDLQEARASFIAVFAQTGAARPVFLLADVTLLLGEAVQARRLYLQALLRDPFEPALRSTRDAGVRELPDAVRDDLEIDEEPEAWSAPAGILLGLLPRPTAEELQAVPPPPTALSAARREALGRARGFVEALVALGEARGEAVIDIRRTMKRLSPALFALYLERVVGRKQG